MKGGRDVNAANRALALFSQGRGASAPSNSQEAAAATPQRMSAESSLAHADTAFGGMASSKVGEPFGPYEVFETLGYGAMAQVLLARTRERPEELLAIKRLMAHMEGSADVVEMFLDEARIGASLDHPNIVRTIEHGAFDGTHFIALEFVVGVSLLEVLRRAAGAIPFPVAAFVVAKVTAALGHAHERLGVDKRPLRVVHRDIKPSNVLLDVEGVVKLIDFGVAKATDRLHQTLGPVIKGSLAYMSPEQASAKAVDHRSDIYSAGILLYELLCGRNPQMGQSDLETLDKVSHGMITPPSTHQAVPSELEDICMRSLARDPGQRFQRAALMARELEAYCSTHGFSRVSLARWIGELPGEAMAEARSRHAAMRAMKRSLPPAATSARSSAPPAAQGPSTDVMARPRFPRPRDITETPVIDEIESDLLTLDSDDIELSQHTREAIIAPARTSTRLLSARRAEPRSGAPGAAMAPGLANAPPLPPRTAESAAPLDETAPRPRAQALSAWSRETPVLAPPQKLRLLRVAVVMFSVLSFAGLAFVVWWTLKPAEGTGKGSAAKTAGAASATSSPAARAAAPPAPMPSPGAAEGDATASGVVAGRNADASAAPDPVDASSSSGSASKTGERTTLKRTAHTALKKPRRTPRRTVRRKTRRPARRTARRTARRPTRRAARRAVRRTARRTARGKLIKKLGDKGAKW